ncbi:hypothetical protein GBF38_019456 [Nibea albiflora]|uniref:Uncharacterized protein n=1 Tax=Nibea albiflora TaxID=240163 RepID=A0ACB7F1G0_NIBAL|nr:hypothetical protein GBF38_019456 [Nibea albiflora]
MTLWWQALILLCCILNCVESSAPCPVQQSAKYHNSFRLARSTLSRVQHLQKRYDWERLHGAFKDMQVYWNMLEWKRTQLEREQVTGRAAHNILAHSMKHVQLDLRDLMRQVSNQMSVMQSSRVKHSPPTARAPLNPEAVSKTAWDRQVEGYIILRDLELYLTKLVRDFLLLASKAHVTQH